MVSRTLYACSTPLQSPWINTSLTITGDCHTGPGNLFPISGSDVYAYTNPIYLDRTGDGWTAPGL